MEFPFHIGYGPPPISVQATGRTQTTPRPFSSRDPGLRSRTSLRSLCPCDYSSPWLSAHAWSNQWRGSPSLPRSTWQQDAALSECSWLQGLSQLGLFFSLWPFVWSLWVQICSCLLAKIIMFVGTDVHFPGQRTPTWLLVNIHALEFCHIGVSKIVVT